MLVESITIGAIIGGSAIAVWLAKNKFQPEIERNLSRIENSDAQVEIVREKRHHK